MSCELERGCRPHLTFQKPDSTNEEALRQLAAGQEGTFWIVADEQTQGRGRMRRQWLSPEGNLYASLVLRLSASASVATQLSFVAALAAHDAIARHLDPGKLPGLRLKWPNDVLLDGAKIAGILIESVARLKAGGLSAIIGIGINVSAAPPDTGRPVAALDLEPAACAAVFRSLADAFEKWLGSWEEGRGFAGIREAWLARALALDKPISVSLNGSSIRGTFRGVDQAAPSSSKPSPGLSSRSPQATFILTPKANNRPQARKPKKQDNNQECQRQERLPNPNLCSCPWRHWGNRP